MKTDGNHVNVIRLKFLACLRCLRALDKFLACPGLMILRRICLADARSAAVEAHRPVLVLLIARSSFTTALGGTTVRPLCRTLLGLLLWRGGWGWLLHLGLLGFAPASAAGPYGALKGAL